MKTKVKKRFNIHKKRLLWPFKKSRSLCAQMITKTKAKPKRRILVDIIRPWLLVIICLLFACTFVDILRQSFNSGQFWNSIIVISYLSAVALWSFLLHFFRFIHVNRWLSAIPRNTQISKSDIGQTILNRIAETRQQCIQKFRNQIDFAAIEHPGLQNPLNNTISIGVPYWELFETIPLFIEEHLTASDQDFEIPESLSLREYLDLAFQRQLLHCESIEVANRFIDLYEYFRYSGRNVNQHYLQDLMVCLQKLVRDIQPAYSSSSQESFQTRISLSNSSVYSQFS